MSNDAEAMTLKYDARQELKPRLRFPEFRDAEGWEVNALSNVADFVSERIPLEQLGVRNYVSTENILPDFSGVTTASKLPTTGSATRFKVNDILVSNIRPYLKKVWFSDKDGGASNDVIVIRAKQALSSQYLPFILKNDSFIAYVMRGAKGVKMPRGDVSLMREYPVVYPSITEQNKIAGCLTSLDDLISAHGRKLDALKSHKKGLMHQLFPCEGETLPRLRFPEFRDAAEWDVKPLEQVATYENGKAHENNISDGGRYIVVNSKFISTEGEVRKYSNDAFCMAASGDILMVLSDVPNGKAIAKCHYVEADNLYTVNQRICRIKPSGIDGKFLLHVLDRNSFLLAFDDGVKQTNLRKEDVLSCPVCFPQLPEEQKKIGDLVSSADKLISSQTQKLDALNTQKIGLMQQLFPSPEEAQA